MVEGRSKQGSKAGEEGSNQGSARTGEALFFAFVSRWWFEGERGQSSLFSSLSFFSFKKDDLHVPSCLLTGCPGLFSLLSDSKTALSARSNTSLGSFSSTRGVQKVLHLQLRLLLRCLVEVGKMSRWTPRRDRAKKAERDHVEILFDLVSQPFPLPPPPPSRSAFIRPSL